jgi:ATP-dependent DNA helicase RecG
MTNAGVPQKNVPPYSSSDTGPSGSRQSSGQSSGGPSGSSSASGKPGAKGPTSKNPEEVPVQFVKGVGPKMGSVLNSMGIETVMDLLRHYPRRHLDFQNRQYIRDLHEDQEVSVFGVIRSVSAFQSKRRPMSILTVLIHDGTGGITITRFVGGKSNKYLLDRYKAQYPKGAQVLASGVVERDKYSHKLTLKNAEVEILTMDSDTEEERQVNSLHAGRLVPVYPLTEGLSLRHLRTIIHNALETYGLHIEETLPASVRSELSLMGLRESIKEIHFPTTVEGKDEARRRLVFDELFAIQLQCAHRRYKFDSTEGALSIKYSDTGLVKQMIEALPFALTGAQNRVFAEIARDLSSSKPMHRLVQGDVGSGKTVVALLAFLVAVENNFQGAMMAPTEILAEQHFRQFERLLTPLGLRAALVLGKHGVKQRREVRQQILTGQIHIAVGTHALLEDDVEFKNLGLIVIDEQHRFGVKQRARLKAKSLNPELLTMTATPIPRTLAMTMHGDLDVSEIDELPPGRKPIKTKALRPSQKKELWDFALKEVMSGRQIYIVFPLIEESESLSAKAATKEFERLQVEFPQLQFGLMHGKLKPQEKDEVMEKFRSKEFNVLVSTTVIEVGVDVPNATIMIIENADRFGLAQLHQLRGRVGRGQDQSYCFLVADMKSETTRQRLDIMQQTNDGFVIAEKDLEIRGPGEFLGYKQSGLPDLLLADLVQDAKILEDARNTAIAIIKEDPELVTEPQLRKVLDRRLGTAEAEIMRSG